MNLENRKQDNNRSRVHLLESERIFLTPPLIEDFDKYYRWFHDKEFVNLVGSYFRPVSYSKNREEFGKSILMCDGSKRVFLSIIIKENGEYIGNVGLDWMELTTMKENVLLEYLLERKDTGIKVMQLRQGN